MYDMLSASLTHAVAVVHVCYTASLHQTACVVQAVIHKSYQFFISVDFRLSVSEQV